MDYAVRFEDVYKEYPFYQHITAGFKSFIFNLPRNIASFKKTRFIALKDVSFEVKKGETFGIIGKNGSGKSTILGLIAIVIKPNRGFVKTDGKVSSLLELGAGFHPDLSGTENIILNGILMGNTREDMLKKMDKIIEFSELGDFIYQPLRTYSSGMYVRLGFSVAVHIEPEILLIDEALAVGDLGFQEKCLKKMIEFKESGTTIIIVSHDMTAIDKLCGRVVWIDSGSIMAIGKPREVVEKYLDHLGQKITPIVEEDQPVQKTKMQSIPVEPEVSQDFINISEPVNEPAVSQDTEGAPQTPIYSWWDSPLIIRQCEELITGNPDVHFYDFLRKQYLIQYLEKGLCIRNRLKGIEANFITYGICKSFDVIEDEDRIADLVAGTSDLKEGYYDLFLCIDVLNHIENLDLFIKKIDHILKDKGFIIALEYVGPSRLSFGDTKDAVSSREVIPLLERFFDIIIIKYFGGPLYDLLINKILDSLDINESKDAAILKLIIQTEQVLVKKGIHENNYALIIARKRSG